MDTTIKRTRTRLSPEKRKQQLLNFALEVFARRGIGRAGHADIAEMAKVSVATVFNYFPTREELVEEVLAQVESRFSEVLALCLDDSDNSLRLRLEAITDNLIEDAIAQKDWVKVWFEWSTSIRDDIWPLFISSNKSSMEKLTNAFAQAIESGELESSQSAEDLARMLHGMCYVLFLQANREPDDTQLRKQAHSYLEVICPLKP